MYFPVEDAKATESSGARKRSKPNKETALPGDIWPPSVDYGQSHTGSAVAAFPARRSEQAASTYCGTQFLQHARIPNATENVDLQLNQRPANSRVRPSAFGEWMTKLIYVGLAGCALCVTPVAADEGVYDGPTAIRPLTVTRKPQHSSLPNPVCDFEHQCYPEKGGSRVPAPVVAPPVGAAKRAAPPVVAARRPGPPTAKRAAFPPVAAKRTAPPPQVPDEPIVATWRDCMDRALQSYEQSHYLHAALRMALGSCKVQVRLEQQGREDYASVETPTPLAAPQVNGRRNIGCGWWPIGSDADRDCATGGRHLR